MNKMDVRHVLARADEEGLPPSSFLAVEAGCVCDGDLNAFGPSWHRGTFWISVECPVHRVKGIETEPKEVATHIEIEGES